MFSLVLPRDLNRLILQYVESPSVTELIRQCWEDQLSYGEGQFSTKTAYHIQPARPNGRTTFGTWDCHLKVTFQRTCFTDGDINYNYQLEMVWCQNGDGLSVYSMESRELEIDQLFPIPFSVVGSMPRAILHAPKYFVGHVWEIERCSFRYKDHEKLDHMHLYYGGHSFEANAMLKVLDSLP
jgi:hypothetical protein